MNKGLRMGLVVLLSCVVLMGGPPLYAEPPEEAGEKSLSVEEQMRQWGYSEEVIKAYYRKEKIKLPPTWPWSPSFPPGERKKEVVAGSWIMTALLGGLTAYFATEHTDVNPQPAIFAGAATGISAIVATIYSVKPVREESALLNLEKGRVVIGMPSPGIKEKESHLSLLKIRF